MSEAKDEACLRNGTPLVPHLCTKGPSVVGTHPIDQPYGCASGGHDIHGRPPDGDNVRDGEADGRTLKDDTLSSVEGMPAASNVSTGVATSDTVAASMSVVAPEPETSADGRQEQDSPAAKLHDSDYDQMSRI